MKSKEWYRERIFRMVLDIESISLLERLYMLAEYLCIYKQKIGTE